MSNPNLSRSRSRSRSRNNSNHIVSTLEQNEIEERNTEKRRKQLQAQLSKGAAGLQRLAGGKYKVRRRSTPQQSQEAEALQRERDRHRSRSQSKSTPPLTTQDWRDVRANIRRDDNYNSDDTIDSNTGSIISPYRKKIRAQKRKAPQPLAPAPNPNPHRTNPRRATTSSNSLGRIRPQSTAPKHVSTARKRATERSPLFLGGITFPRGVAGAGATTGTGATTSSVPRPSLPTTTTNTNTGRNIHPFIIDVDQPLPTNPRQRKKKKSRLQIELDREEQHQVNSLGGVCGANGAGATTSSVPRPSVPTTTTNTNTHTGNIHPFIIDVDQPLPTNPRQRKKKKSRSKSTSSSNTSNTVQFVNRISKTNIGAHYKEQVLPLIGKNQNHSKKNDKKIDGMQLEMNQMKRTLSKTLKVVNKKLNVHETYLKKHNKKISEHELKLDKHENQININTANITELSQKIDGFKNVQQCIQAAIKRNGMRVNYLFVANIKTISEIFENIYWFINADDFDHSNKITIRFGHDMLRDDDGKIGARKRGTKGLQNKINTLFNNEWLQKRRLIFTSTDFCKAKNEDEIRCNYFVSMADQFAIGGCLYYANPEVEHTFALLQKCDEKRNEIDWSKYTENDIKSSLKLNDVYQDLDYLNKRNGKDYDLAPPDYKQIDVPNGIHHLSIFHNTRTGNYITVLDGGLPNELKNKPKHYWFLRLLIVYKDAKPSEYPTSPPTSVIAALNWDQIKKPLGLGNMRFN
eukprot:CAMPEP_0201594602 /NCGR_PEP_ID=MMETSP0190_2-20130828/191871_1 /ASSEMBLY_ACC=CAM_ASM_000263 /TAXON_ID=37353 /ORGANISM="Rosalina sp." /LENGTH=743 /DNA_ID=CAMNT_0048054283 /DNA_START=90 /DNA_END=2320 /DNA_ORIENTATION=+